jgi:AcrR family transcriptional regulator
MAEAADNSGTRRQLLRAALKRFAHSGYAASSVQDIVDDAKLSKPALYYHFADKAALFQALVHEAHDERYRLLCEAAEKSRDIRGRLEGILTVLFDYFRQNRELMRISFATMFAAPGEVPPNLSYADKCTRNFEFIHALIRRAQKNGELDRCFDCEDLAFGFYGLANFYLVTNIVAPDCGPDKYAAKKVVQLFFAGAGPKPVEKKSRKQTKGKK